MNVFEFIVIIVAIGAIARVLQARYAARQARPIEDGDTLRAPDEVRRLKERIQVLERVITDNHGSQELDREIDRLRDR